jgi:hypothetical protein
MLKADNIRANVFLLDKGILWVAVVALIWVCDGSCFSVNELESLVKVWAMLETFNVGSDIFRLLLDELEVCVAVVMDLWIWNSFGLAISKSESFVEIWAVLNSHNSWSCWLSLNWSCYLWCWGWDGFCSSILLMELVIRFAVIVDLWVWNSFGLSIGQGESLVKIWAVWKTVDTWSPVWILFGFLGKLIVSLAVKVDFWVWNSLGLTISQSESLIKIWAVRKRIDRWSPVWISLLNKLVIRFAVVVNLRIWNCLSLSIGKSESLIEVWAMWETVDGRSPVWILLLNKLVIRFAVVVNLRIWNSLSLSISKSESLIEIWAVWKRIDGWSPVWIAQFKSTRVTD